MWATLLFLALASNPAQMAGPPSPLRAAVSATLGPHVFSALTEEIGAECAGTDYTSPQAIAIAVARSGSAYCTKADGTLVLIAANKPRITTAGIYAEGAHSNLVIRSQELDNAAWTKSNVAVPSANTDTDPALGTTAETGATTSAGGYYESTAWVPSTTIGMASFYVKTAAGTQAGAIVVRDTTAGADRGTCTYTATTSYQRVICQWTGGTGANNHVIRWYPGGVAGEGSSIAWGFQAENTGSATEPALSYLPTGAASVTMVAEGLSFVIPSAISATGCVSLTATTTPSLISSGGTMFAITSNGRAIQGVSTTALQANDVTNQVQRTSLTSLVGRSVNVKTTWTGATMTFTADGTTASGSFDGSMGSGTTLRIGSSAAGSGYYNGWYKNIRVNDTATGCD